MNNTGTGYEEARLNYFGRVNYAYKSKYLAEFVWRYQGSYILIVLINSDSFRVFH